MYDDYRDCIWIVFDSYIRADQFLGCSWVSSTMNAVRMEIKARIISYFLIIIISNFNFYTLYLLCINLIYSWIKFVISNCSLISFCTVNNVRRYLMCDVK